MRQLAAIVQSLVFDGIDGRVVLIEFLGAMYTNEVSQIQGRNGIVGDSGLFQLTGIRRLNFFAFLHGGGVPQDLLLRTNLQACLCSSRQTNEPPGTFGYFLRRRRASGDSAQQQITKEAPGFAGLNDARYIARSRVGNVIYLLAF